jgi:hypothetical protein
MNEGADVNLPSCRTPISAVSAKPQQGASVYWMNIQFLRP